MAVAFLIYRFFAHTDMALRQFERMDYTLQIARMHDTLIHDTPSVMRVTA